MEIVIRFFFYLFPHAGSKCAGSVALLSVFNLFAGQVTTRLPGLIIPLIWLLAFLQRNSLHGLLSWDSSNAKCCHDWATSVHDGLHVAVTVVDGMDV